MAYYCVRSQMNTDPGIGGRWQVARREAHMSPKQRRGRVMVQAPDGTDTDVIDEQVQPTAPDTAEALEQQNAEAPTEAEVETEAQTEADLSPSNGYGPQRAFGSGSDGASLDDALRATGQRIAIWSELLRSWLLSFVAWVEVEVERGRIASGPLRRRYVAWQRQFLRQAGIAAKAASRRAVTLGRAAITSLLGSVQDTAARLRRGRAGHLARDRSAGQTRRRSERAAQAQMDSSADEEELERISLRDIALEAWQARQVTETANLEEQRAYEAERDATALRQLLAQRLGIRSAPSGSHVEVDGIVFGVRWSRLARTPDLVIVGACPKCGAPVASGDIFDLADLGAVLDDIAHERNLCEECRASVNDSGPVNETGGSTTRASRDAASAEQSDTEDRATRSSEEGRAPAEHAPFDERPDADRVVAAQATRTGPVLELGPFAPPDVIQQQNGVESSAHREADA